jgi:uncharacterized membrane protein YkoI
MKNLKIAALALFATAAVSAQDLQMNEVPANLTDSFQKENPNATDVEWEMEGMNYKVEFDVNRMEHEIWYSKDGETVRREQELSKKDLPSSITDMIESKYSEYKIDSVEMTEKDGKKTYEVELEKGWTEEKTLILDESGKVINEYKD